MRTVNKKYMRGDSKPFTIIVDGDYSSSDYKLCWSLFDKCDLVSIPFLQIKSDNNGGSSGQLIATYNSSEDESTITITPKQEDTENKAIRKYYYSLTLTNDTIHETIATGEFKLLWDGENPYNGMPEPVIEEKNYKYPGHSHYYALKLTPPDTFSIEVAAFGFTGTLSQQVIGDKIRITSTEQEFDDLFRAECSVQSNWETIDANTFDVELQPNWAIKSYVMITIMKGVF